MAGTQLYFDIMARDHASSVFNKVGAAADKLGQRTDRASKSHQSFGRAVRWAGGMVSMYGIGQFLRSSVQEYANAEAAQNKLANSYQRFPKMQSVALQSFKDLNTQLQMHTRFDDDDAAAMQANLARFDLTGKQVMKLTPLVADLAQVQGTDMVTAGDRLGKAMLGNTRALKSLGISYTSTGNRAKDMRNVVDLISKKVGGEAAKSADTAAVKMAILGNQWGELKEAVGTAALPGVTKLAEVAGPAMDDFGQAIRRNLPAIQQGFEDAWEAGSKLAGIGKSIWSGFTSIPEDTRQLLLALAGGTWAVGKLKGSALGQGIGSIFSAVKGMNVNAGVVNVNGKAGGLPGAGGGGKGSPGMPFMGGLLGAVTLIATGAVIFNAKQHLNDPRHPMPSPAPGPATIPGNAGRPVVSQGNRDSDWISTGKQNRALEAQSARLNLLARDWQGVNGKIRQASGSQVQWGEAAKQATMKGIGGVTAFGAAVKKVPTKKHTSIKADGADEARGKVKGLGGAIGGLKGKTVGVKESGAQPSTGRVKGLGGAIGGLKGKTVSVQVQNAQAVAALAQVTTALAAVQSKTAYVNIVTRKTGTAMATGGYISGPGTSTSDSIHIMASDGEFMQPADAVAHYGVGFMEAIRQRRFPKPKGYAKGGKISKAQRKAQAQDLRQARRENRQAASARAFDALDPQSQTNQAAGEVAAARAAIKAAKTDKKRAAAVRKLTAAQERFAQASSALTDQQNASTEATNEAAAQAIADRDAAWQSMQQARQDRAWADAPANVRASAAQNEVANLNAQLAATSDPARLAQLVSALEDAEEKLTSAQDQILDQVNALRDAVDGLAGGFRAFAGIGTTAINDVADAQSKLTEANDAVSAAQKKMDLAGSDRERAAAAAELTKALQAQQSAQQGVNQAGKPTSASIKTNMATRLQKLRDFSTYVQQLKAGGLNATTLAEILQMGPEQGADFAKALLDGGFADINTLQNQITAESATLGFIQNTTQAASDSLTGYAAAQAAGLVSGGIVMAPAPVTVSIDGNAIAQALISYKRQNGGSAPGLSI